MKLLFFGTGSIGQRHINLLLKHFDHEIYAFRSGQGVLYKNHEVKEIHSWDEVDELRPDVAFICNPTYLHIKTAIECAERGIKLFIEKPVDCSTKGLDYLLRLIVEHGIVTYVAYPFRFNDAIRKFKKENKTNYLNIIRCLTNLDTWRGYQTYSAKKSQGGGALLELSHEIDLAEYLFGEIIKLDSSLYNHGKVQTDAEELAVLYATHRNCSTHIVLDIASGRQERSIITNSIMSYFVTDQMYLDQLVYFFDNIDNSRMMNNLPDASILFKKIMRVRGE